MSESRNLAQFSANRLGGEPVPDDVRVLLAHRSELFKRTGIELNWKKAWAPWLDTSYLSDTDLANPDITANVRAIQEVCGLIAFIAVHEDDEYFGYWRGPANRSVAETPLVYLDNEGQFRLCGGSTFAEAVLSRVYSKEEFAKLRNWLRKIGVATLPETSAGLVYPKDEITPAGLHNELYYRYRAI